MFYISKENFNAKDTFECGQVFRFQRLDEQRYSICSGNQFAIVSEENKSFSVNSSDDDYFKNYFDLDTNYAKICQILSEDVILQDAIGFGCGIRLLNQDVFEMIISFIISQNNNIPRIKKIIEGICQRVGARKLFEGIEYFAFPKPQELAALTEKDFAGLGAGYRAKFLEAAAKKIAKGFDLEALKKLPDEELKAELLKFLGIGNKVCDCIMLFGFKRTRAFPVDTWLEKVYNDTYQQKLTREQISKFYSKKYGDLAGFAQQYLFYNQRSNKNVKGQDRK